MLITHKGKQINVTKVTGNQNSVNVHRVGRRVKFVSDSGQVYLKVTNVWYEFPQEIEY